MMEINPAYVQYLKDLLAIATHKIAERDQEIFELKQKLYQYTGKHRPKVLRQPKIEPLPIGMNQGGL